MPIGDSYKYIMKNPNLKFLISIVGTLDLHSHIRIKPLITFFKQEYSKKDVNILEIGCGNGINAFELYKCNNNIKYQGFDLNLTSINEAKKIAYEIGINENIVFKCEDATKSNFNLEQKFDIILLFDFLEHIENPKEFLNSINHLISYETVIICSVPTYQYKKIFGKEFHKKVGHVKDGYDIKELSNLFEKIDYETKLYSYNTGIFSIIGCYLFYRDFPKNIYVNFLKKIILYPFIFLDIYNSEKVSCTLFAVFSRRK